MIPAPHRANVLLTIKKGKMLPFIASYRDAFDSAQNIFPSCLGAPWCRSLSPERVTVFAYLSSLQKKRRWWSAVLRFARLGRCIYNAKGGPHASQRLFHFSDGAPVWAVLFRTVDLIWWGGSPCESRPDSSETYCQLRCCKCVQAQHRWGHW